MIVLVLSQFNHGAAGGDQLVHICFPPLKESLHRMSLEIVAKWEFLQHFVVFYSKHSLRKTVTHIQRRGNKIKQINIKLTVSQVFSLWFENVENEGSITPDKAIVESNNFLKITILSQSRAERQPHQSPCVFFTVASSQLRSET